jgi:hypothetical protein
MDPVEEYAQLKAVIRAMEGRAQILREEFLKPGARLQSDRYQIVVTNRVGPATAVTPAIVTVRVLETARRALPM